MAIAFISIVFEFKSIHDISLSLSLLICLLFDDVIVLMEDSSGSESSFQGENGTVGER